MTSSGAAKVTLPTDEHILVTREFDAPKDLVYRAWTTPELVKQWWSGRRGKVTICEIDLRVGGRWRYVMEADGGFEVAFNGEFREIVPNEQIVSTEIYESPVTEGVEPAVNTITFTEVDGRTRLEILMDAHTQEVRDMILESGMEAGMQESLDALEQVAIALR